MSAAVVVEHAPGCGGVPIVLFALEELGRPYTLVVRPNGYFLATYGVPGPRVTIGELSELGPGAIASLANGVERVHIEAFMKLFHPAVRAVFADRNDGIARVALDGALDHVAATLGEQRYLCGDPSIADACGLALRVLGVLGVDLAPWPSLVQYRDRVMARPAWARAMARAAENDPETVLRFWFEGDAALHRKMKRWFMGGDALDDELRAHFGRTIERALSGELDAWATSPRGLLALVLVLDQFTRNVFRGTPRMYAGDERARALVENANGANLALPIEQAIFLNMPFVHAEDPEAQARALAEAERIVEAGPPELRDMLGVGIEQATKYQDIIARFGRFPHRNAILGRTSTAEEELFLVDWKDRAPPARMRAVG